MSAGKGDKPRPVNKKEFDTNFDKINWNKDLTSTTDRVLKDNGKKKTFVYRK